MLLYQAYSFILPAFKPGERRVVLPLLLAVPVLFVAGAVFAYFVVHAGGARLPARLQRRRVQHRGPRERVLRVLRPHADLGRAACSRSRSATLAVTRLAIVTPEQLAANRRYAVLVIAVAAMLLPGTDPVTMLISMAPLYALFEVSLLLARRFGRPPATIGGWPAASSALPSAARGGLALAPSAAASVLYVGDSLGVGTVAVPARAARRRRARGRREDRPRRAAPASTCSRSLIAPEHDVVVFDLGTNDDPAAPEPLAADLERRGEIAGDRCLVVATLNRPPLNGVPVDGLNRAVTSFAARDPNVALVDWQRGRRRGSGRC